MWLLRGAPKNREVAKRILERMGDKLTKSRKTTSLKL